MRRSIWLGFDSREPQAFAVARSSAKRHLTQPIPIHGLVLSDLISRQLYHRPMEWRLGPAGHAIMWDLISDAPQSTEFACSRFLTPLLAKTGWALFSDCDVMFRKNLVRVFDNLDPKYAVYCVKHDFTPITSVKMDGQAQLPYKRKLWSSFCIFNCEHPANQALTIASINSVPGRDLHAFYWLADSDIGELSPIWNWIPGVSSEMIEPSCVHFSEGGPWLDHYKDVQFAQEWWNELYQWALK